MFWRPTCLFQFEHAEQIIQQRIVDYNEIRPHPSLNFQTPDSYAASIFEGTNGGDICRKKMEMEYSNQLPRAADGSESLNLGDFLSMVGNMRPKNIFQEINNLYMRRYLPIVVFFFCGCVNKSKVDRKTFNDYIIECEFVGDSICHGLATFYSIEGVKKSQFYFEYGIKVGPGINFFPNGFMSDSANYRFGFREGFHYTYGPIGDLQYIDNYYRGLRVGPHLFYNNRTITEFHFTNFEGKILYACKYDSLGLVAFNGSLLNSTLYTMYEDGIKKNGLFLYIIDPPKISVQYSLGLTELRTGQKTKLLDISKSSVFIDTLLFPPEPETRYYLSAEYKDSINGDHKIYIDDLIWQY